MTSRSSTKYRICCNKGKVRLETLFLSYKQALESHFIKHMVRCICMLLMPILDTSKVGIKSVYTCQNTISSLINTDQQFVPHYHNLVCWWSFSTVTTSADRRILQIKFVSALLLEKIMHNWCVLIRACTLITANLYPGVTIGPVSWVNWFTSRGLMGKVFKNLLKRPGALIPCM